MAPERAIARLRRADGGLVGVGLAFAVLPRYLVTCAHVVNAALGRPQRDSVAPGPAELWLEFPFGGGRDDHVHRRATVASWLADRGSFDLYDVATLQLDEDLPAGVTILSLAEFDPHGPVQMWGPTEERQFSGHVSGWLMGSVDKSRLQIDQELRGVFRVQSGFSGGPVWQPSTSKVVGLLQASSVDNDASDAYVLGADLIVDACRDLHDPGVAVPDPTLTVLHLSNLRFEAQHWLDGEGFTDADRHPDRLVAQVLGDLADVRSDSGLTPDLVVVTGDVAAHAKPVEYDMAYAFLTTLRAELRLDLSRFVVVPGSHDVNRGKCQAYFLDREAEDEAVVQPYWPKWEPYATMFTRLYGAEFRMDQPWQFVEIPELKLVVAGLNSTMAESHRDADHYGWLGEEQLHWFAARIEQAQARGWFRLGVLHHKPIRGSGHDRAHLRDADLFAELVAPRLNAVLHGHAHDTKGHQSGSSALAVLGSAGAGVTSGARQPEGPIQYQLVELHRDRLRVSARRYDPGRLRWAGDTSTSESSRRDILTRFTEVDAVFPPLVGLVSDSAATVVRWGGRAITDDPDRDDLLSRIAEVCRLRLPEANVREVRRPGGAQSYLHVGIVQELGDGRRVPVEQYPVGACERTATHEEVDRFVTAVGARYIAGGTSVSYKLVYDGPPAVADVRERALRRGVELLSFAEYQVGYDLRPYAQRQAERLARNSAYAPTLYVAQRYTEIEGYGPVPDAAPAQEDLLERLRGWLAEPDGHLVVVLGAFGHGKTFLLRELTRRMHEEGDLAVPVLVHLRDLEKAHDLDQLVAAQLTAGGERRIDLTMFRYLLSEGRIALLFDGFDELAVRVTYDAAARHLDKILQAAEGRAKVVLASRDQHFLTDAEVFSALGDRLATVAGRRLVKLSKFDDDQIETFPAQPARWHRARDTLAQPTTKHQGPAGAVAEPTDAGLHYPDQRGPLTRSARADRRGHRCDGL